MMDVIDEETFESVEKFENETQEDDDYNLTESEFQSLLNKLENPVEAQKHLAVKIKFFLDKRMSKELLDKGLLSDHTRRWVKDYNTLLDNIHKNIHGDKSVNLHVLAVSHSQVGAKIRAVKEL